MVGSTKRVGVSWCLKVVVNFSDIEKKFTQISNYLMTDKVLYLNIFIYSFILDESKWSVYKGYTLVDEYYKKDSALLVSYLMTKHAKTATLRTSQKNINTPDMTRNYTKSNKNLNI